LEFRRVLFRSSRANIELETSIAITISIPFVVLVLLLTFTVRGRAIATRIKLSAMIRSTNSIGYNFETNDFLYLNPLIELTFTDAVCSFRLMTYQAIAGNNNRNNQKNSGF